ncbi:MAG: hypothetical protein U0Q18_22000 [Bryobacteraceae bacterium]
MRLVILSAVLATVALAQTPANPSETPPPEVEKALRARVSEFYQAQVDGKFRQAEPLVAEDSKDLYVGSNKPRYIGYEIKRIDWSEHFSKATVHVLISRLVPVPGFEGKPLKGLIPSRWRLENGLWFWYSDPKDMPSSPFGVMKPPAGGLAAPTGGPGAPPAMPPGITPPVMPGAGVPGKPATGGAGAPPPIPPMPKPQATASTDHPKSNPPAKPAAASTALKLDKTSVVLKRDAASSDQVTFVNQSQSSVKLIPIPAPLPGLTLKLDKTEVPAGGKAVLAIQSAGGIKTPTSVSVRVMPQNQLLSFKINVAAPGK